MYLYDININIYYIFNIHTYIYIWIPQFWYYRLFPFILQTSNYSVSHQMVMSFSCLKVIWAWSRFNNKTNSEFCNILHIPHFLLMLVNYYSEKKSNNSASSPRAPTPPAAESRCTFQLNLPGRSSGGSHTPHPGWDFFLYFMATDLSFPKSFVLQGIHGNQPFLSSL